MYFRVKLRAWHLELLQEKIPAPNSVIMLVGDGSFGRYLEGQNSWALFYNDCLLGCAGTIKMWNRRYNGWAVMTEDCAGHMVAITRHTRRVLADVHGRLETTVKADFDLGHRWAKLLGFEVENPPGLLREYDASGEDFVSYVRFNP